MCIMSLTTAKYKVTDLAIIIQKTLREINRVRFADADDFQTVTLLLSLTRLLLLLLVS